MAEYLKTTDQGLVPFINSSESTKRTLLGWDDPYSADANTTDDNPDSGKRKLAVVLLVLSVSIQVTGTFLNGGILIILLKEGWSTIKKHVLVINLIFTDLLISTFVVSFNTGYYTRGTWIGSSRGCRISAFLYHFLESTSVYTMAAIAIDRFYTVTGGRCETNRLVRHTCKLAATTWVVALVISIFPLLGWSRYYLDSSGVCGPDWTGKDIMCRSYTVVLVTVAFLAPISLQTGAYIKLYREVDAASMKVRYGQSCLVSATLNALSLGSLTRASDVPRLRDIALKKRRDLSNQKRLAKVMISMVTMLVCTWLPYCISLILLNFTHMSPEVLKVVSLLPALNVIYDPVAYVFYNRNLRRSLSVCLNPAYHGFQRLWAWTKSSSQVSPNAVVVAETLACRWVKGRKHGRVVEKERKKQDPGEGQNCRIHQISKRPSLYTILEISSQWSNDSDRRVAYVGPEIPSKVITSGSDKTRVPITLQTLRYGSKLKVLRGDCLANLSPETDGSAITEDSETQKRKALVHLSLRDSMSIGNETSKLPNVEN